ncbi:MAG: T9SS type A sorting domain-containing protein [Arachidicoccus sp.]|nr:T9SS type A sorting domain-containing protein [Arachidicoccus sp.]
MQEILFNLKRLCSLCFLISIFCLCALFANAQSPLFVKSSASGSGDGSSWDNALGGYAGLQSAVATASMNGNPVYLAAGTYNVTAGNPLIVTPGKNYHIKGGYPVSATGTDTSGFNSTTNITTIDGTNATLHLFEESTINNGVTTENFSLTGLQINNFTATVGGAVMLINGPGTTNISYFINNCTFKGNSTSVDGGVFYFASAAIGGSSVINFQNDYFYNNSAADGGCLYLTTVYNSTTSNTGNFIINNCAFVGNSSVYSGGAIYLTTSHGWTITNTTFCSNKSVSNYQGGAIYMTTSFYNILSGCNFLNNTGGTQGGAIYATTAGATITSTLFAGNTVGGTTTDQYADIALLTPYPSATSFSIGSSYLQDPTTSDYTGESITLNSGNYYNDYSTITIPSGCPLTVANTLPIVLKNVYVTVSVNIPTLYWVTESEINSKDFVVERSTDNKTWTPVSTIAAAGNSSGLLNYHYTDNSEGLNGKIYYRIKMNDNGGNSKYSATVSALIGNNAGSYVLYPIPVKDNLSISGVSNTSTVFKIINTNGQVVYSFKGNTANISELANGIYFVQAIIDNNHVTYVGKIIKQ